MPKNRARMHFMFLVTVIAVLVYIVVRTILAPYDPGSTWFGDLTPPPPTTTTKRKYVKYEDTIAGRSFEYTVKDRKTKVWIPDNYTGIPCDYNLDLTKDEIIQKVESYEFPGIQNYIDDLFPDSEYIELPHDPVFVTGFSSNHFEEGLAMIYNFNTMINRNKTRTLIVYDIGLNKREIEQVVKECGCQVRRFPFEIFPDHVCILKPCAWKPLIIQLMAKEHHFVAWLDASVRFKTTNIDDMLHRARTYGVMATKGLFYIADQTLADTFR